MINVGIFICSLLACWGLIVMLKEYQRFRRLEARRERYARFWRWVRLEKKHPATLSRALRAMRDPDWDARGPWEEIP